MIRRISALCVCVVLCTVTTVLGLVEQAPSATPKSNTVGFAIPPGTTGFVSLHMAPLWDHKALLGLREARGKAELVWLVQSIIGLPPADLERVLVFWKSVNTPHVLVTSRRPIDMAAVVDRTQRPGGKPQGQPAHPRIRIVANAEFPHLAIVNERTLLFAPETTDPTELVKWIEQPVNGTQTLAVPYQEIGKHTLLIALDAKAIAQLPQDVRTVLCDADLAVLTVDIGAQDRASAELRLRLTNHAKAVAAEPIFNRKLNELAGWARELEKKTNDQLADSGSQPGPLLERCAVLLKSAGVRIEGSQLIARVDFDLSELVERVLLAAPDSALANRGDSPATNNLKQLGIAIHSYHDAFNACPSNSYDKNGKPLLSWRVHILPFIEQNALYSQFKLDEPWDSEHNKPLSKIVIKTYTIPGRPTEAGQTYFQSFIKPKGSADPFNPWLVEGQSKGPQLVTILDGTSNTVMVAEAAEPVIWSKPDDLVYEDKKPLPKLGGPNGRVTVLFGDGSVQTFRRGQIDERTWRGLITRDGGEVVNIPR